MAEINYTHTTSGIIEEWFWETVTESDTVKEVELSSVTFSDLAVFVTGTFGGATATVQMSVDGTNWVTAQTVANADATATAEAALFLRDQPRYIRVTMSGGTSQDLDITLTGTVLRIR